MARLKIDYGIDLGTTNSAVARIENGVSNILEIDNSKTLPSAVLYDRKGRVRVGITAKSNKDSFVEMKRDMGFDELKNDPDAKTSDGEKITPETLSAEVLKKLSERVNDEVFKSVVITVPALFEAGAVEATKRAAKLAGFEQIEILMEPVAAATAFGMQNPGATGKWLVFDFGGGTFDASLLEVEEGIMKVVGSEGDPRLGGGDLDRALLNQIMLPTIKSEYNLEGLSDDKLKGFNNSLKNEADKIKIQLSFNEEYDYSSDLDMFGDDADGNEIDLEYVFTKDKVHDIFLPYYQKSIDCVKKLLERHKISISEIDELILVGGPTQIPSFRKLIEEQLKKPNTSVDPMSGIAIGAALFASNIKNEIKEHGNSLISNDSDEVDVHIEEISVEYKSLTVLDIEPVTILKKDKKRKLFAILEKSDGSWETPKQELDDVFNCDLSDGPNNFIIKVFDENSNNIKCNFTELNITKGLGEAETSLPLHIGIEIVDTRKKRRIFRALAGLEIERPLPAVGLSKPNGELRTMGQIRPGVIEDKIKIKLYQAEADANGTRSKLHKYSGLEFVICGNDVPKLIPENSVINITVNIDRSQNVTFEAEFPELDIVIDDLPPAPIDSQKITSPEEVEDLLNEANSIIDDLSSSFPIPDSLEDLKNQSDKIKKDWNDNKDSVQSFRNLQALVLQLDKVLDLQEWPKLEEDIKKSINDLEKLVDECVTKQLKGFEQDKSDLESFKTNFNQLQPTKNKSLGQDLLDNINGKIYQITDRHAGKEQAEAYIRSFNNQFSTINWKNTSQARAEVDRGMQMITLGSSESELKQQLGKIFNQMQDPDSGFGGGGLKG
ncbi:Hsp70 family protein [Flavobacteriales bacterium]|nr:Hsp70 family protein [Flavobacteriales bacterium]